MDTAKEGGEQAIHRAAHWGRVEVVRLLLARGADPEAKTGADWRPLHYAAVRKDAEVVKLLLSKWVDVEACDVLGWHPLHCAARNDNGEVLELLLEYGADPRFHNHEGKKPREMCKKKETRAMLQKAEDEWNDPAARERKALAEHLRRQRKLGALRPKGPSL